MAAGIDPAEVDGQALRGWSQRYRPSMNSVPLRLGGEQRAAFAARTGVVETLAPAGRFKTEAPRNLVETSICDCDGGHDLHVGADGVMLPDSSPRLAHGP